MIFDVIFVIIILDAAFSLYFIYIASINANLKCTHANLSVRPWKYEPDKIIHECHNEIVEEGGVGGGGMGQSRGMKHCH